MTHQDRHVVFYHAPQSRSRGTLNLLEELEADYELRVLDLEATRQPAYLAVNPMGKVPAILHRGMLVAEQPAVMIYLADLYADRGLAPALDDPLRGPYLRWLVFYGSCFEPALIDRSMQRELAPPSRSPYGSWDDVMNALTGQLAAGPWLLGGRFTAADVLWGTALHWTIGFRLVPELPLLREYVDRVHARPGMQRAAAREEALRAGRS
ncbi:glutathione S-transferase family protein [Fulvimonas soli]|jgi:glutathione S-transferase|uniref:Glutathione S-transferase n=1 Tax=Fulvimonas soli TaxID=155197 RepID=A0A316IHN9_9GAMM|nr:glutathione S-transferase family protein [Fulvimonas soli]PWK92563.1 glutathione S-transferase [Fulvimonas soli]TNY27769.1 glutathione S-transferase [Fulvimonas soli]